MPRPVHKAFVEEFVDALGPYCVATCARTGRTSFAYHTPAAETVESVIQRALTYLCHMCRCGGRGKPRAVEHVHA